MLDDNCSSQGRRQRGVGRELSDLLLHSGEVDAPLVWHHLVQYPFAGLGTASTDTARGGKAAAMAAFVASLHAACIVRTREIPTVMAAVITALPVEPGPGRRAPASRRRRSAGGCAQKGVQMCPKWRWPGPHLSLRGVVPWAVPNGVPGPSGTKRI